MGNWVRVVTIYALGFTRRRRLWPYGRNIILIVSSKPRDGRKVFRAMGLRGERLSLVWEWNSDRVARQGLPSIDLFSGANMHLLADGANGHDHRVCGGDVMCVYLTII